MIGAESGGIDRFGKLYPVTFVRFEIDDLDLLQTVFPFRKDRVILEQIHTFDLDRGPVSYKLLPILFRWIGDRRRYYAKVLGAFICANVEKVAAMIDVVFVIGLTREDRFPNGVGVVSGDKAKFSGGLAERSQRDHGLIPAPIDADVEELVLLFVQHLVLIRAQNVAKHFVVALRDRIFSHIEKSLVVGGPGQVIDAFNFLGQQFARAQILDLQSVLSIAG